MPRGPPEHGRPNYVLRSMCAARRVGEGNGAAIVEEILEVVRSQRLPVSGAELRLQSARPAVSRAHGGCLLKHKPDDLRIALSYLSARICCTCLRKIR